MHSLPVAGIPHSRANHPGGQQKLLLPTISCRALFKVSTAVNTAVQASPHSTHSHPQGVSTHVFIARIDHGTEHTNQLDIGCARPDSTARSLHHTPTASQHSVSFFHLQQEQDQQQQQQQLVHDGGVAATQSAEPAAMVASTAARPYGSQQQQQQQHNQQPIQQPREHTSLPVRPPPPPQDQQAALQPWEQQLEQCSHWRQLLPLTANLQQLPQVTAVLNRAVLLQPGTAAVAAAAKQGSQAAAVAGNTQAGLSVDADACEEQQFERLLSHLLRVTHQLLQQQSKSQAAASRTAPPVPLKADCAAAPGAELLQLLQGLAAVQTHRRPQLCRQLQQLPLAAAIQQQVGSWSQPQALQVVLQLAVLSTGKRLPYQLQQQLCAAGFGLTAALQHGCCSSNRDHSSTSKSRPALAGADAEEQQQQHDFHLQLQQQQQQEVQLPAVSAVAQVLWAASRLSWRPQQQLLQQAAVTLLLQLRACSSSELAMAVWGLAQLGVQYGQLQQWWSQQMILSHGQTVTLHQQEQQQQQQQQQQHPNVSEVLSHALRQHSTAFTAPECVGVLWAAVQLQLLPEVGTMRALLQALAAPQVLLGLTNDDITSVLWCLARVQKAAALRRAQAHTWQQQQRQQQQRQQQQQQQQQQEQQQQQQQQEEQKCAPVPHAGGLQQPQRQPHGADSPRHMQHQHLHHVQQQREAGQHVLQGSLDEAAQQAEEDVLQQLEHYSHPLPAWDPGTNTSQQWQQRRRRQRQQRAALHAQLLQQPTLIPPELLQPLLQAYYTMLPTCSGSSIARTLWSVSVLGLQPPPAWVAGVLAVLEPQLSDLDATSFMLVALALARLRYLPEGQWLKRFWAASIPCLPHACTIQQQPLQQKLSQHGQHAAHDYSSTNSTNSPATTSSSSSSSSGSGSPTTTTATSPAGGSSIRRRPLSTAELAAVAASAYELSLMTRPGAKGPWKGQKPPADWLDALAGATVGCLTPDLDLSTLLLWGEVMMRFSSMAGHYWPGPGAAWWQGFEAATKPYLHAAEPKELLRLAKMLSTQQQHRPVGASWVEALLAATQACLVTATAGHTSHTGHTNHTGHTSGAAPVGHSFQGAGAAGAAGPLRHQPQALLVGRNGPGSTASRKAPAGRASALGRQQQQQQQQQQRSAAGVPVRKVGELSGSKPLSACNLANLGKAVCDLGVMPGDGWLQAWELAVELAGSGMSREVGASLRRTRAAFARMRAEL